MIAQLVKHFPHTPEDLSSSPSIHLESVMVVHMVHACNPSVGEVKKVSPWSWITRQPCLLCKPQASEMVPQTPRWGQAMVVHTLNLNTWWQRWKQADL